MSQCLLFVRAISFKMIDVNDIGFWIKYSVLWRIFVLLHFVYACYAIHKCTYVFPVAYPKLTLIIESCNESTDYRRLSLLNSAFSVNNNWNLWVLWIVKTTSAGWNYNYITSGSSGWVGSDDKAAGWRCGSLWNSWKESFKKFVTTIIHTRNKKNISPAFKLFKRLSTAFINYSCMHTSWMERFMSCYVKKHRLFVS